MKHHILHIRCVKNFRVFGTIALNFLIILGILAVFPIVDGVSKANASYTPAETTLNIIASKDTASVEAVPDSANGTFVISDALNEVEFTVSTNNLTGYNLNILSADSSGQLVNANTGDTLDTITSDVTEDDFRNGSASTYVNKWGYRLKINGTTTTNFLSAPTTTNRTIHTTSGPNTPGTSDNFTLGIGARIDYTKPSGTYTNTFVLTAVGNPITYQINYLDNSSGSDVAILPAEGSSNITASAFTLSSTIPTRVGYDFKGWCDGTVDHETSPSTCDGVTYNASDSFVFSNASISGVAEANLYAMWEFVPIPLYDQIASMSKGTQTAAELRATLIEPKSSVTISPNSGVYEYNVSEFGVATDAANTHKIYYYRGVLDSYGHTGFWGSDGLADAYPNYVKLGNTCWRIVRTTGSGGIKMIYNGNWEGSTCANYEANTQIGENSFAIDSDKIYGSALGYTQNGSYNGFGSSAAYGTMFGTNTNFSANSTDSGIKTYIENWYNNTSGIKATYGAHLEADAGYCGDRTLNSGTSWSTPMADSATVDEFSSYYAGAYVRSQDSTRNPTLTCPRNNADVYTTSAATTGNKQLSEPIALITADEASFSGSGWGGSDRPQYTGRSFLNPGLGFWLLSPASHSGGEAYMFHLHLYGGIGVNYNSTLGVRPAISLSPGAKITVGNGTATSPWEVSW